MLELPKSIDVKGPDGNIASDFPMWKYWCLQEGTLGVDPNMQRTLNGDLPPVIHVDSDAPLYSNVDQSLITDEMWGIYYKPDFNFGGIQGGAAPHRVETDPEEVSGRSLRGLIAGLCGRRRFRRNVGIRPWRTVRSASKGRMASIGTRSPAASVRSLLTISRYSMCFATIATLSPTRITATK